METKPPNKLIHAFSSEGTVLIAGPCDSHSTLRRRSRGTVPRLAKGRTAPKSSRCGERRRLDDGRQATTTHSRMRSRNMISSGACGNLRSSLAICCHSCLEPNTKNSRLPATRLRRSSAPVPYGKSQATKCDWNREFRFRFLPPKITAFIWTWGPSATLFGHRSTPTEPVYRRLSPGSPLQRQIAGFRT